MSEYVINAEGLESELARVAGLTEVVRCRGCRHMVKFKEASGKDRVYCGLRHSLYAVETDGFCSWGERRGR